MIIAITANGETLEAPVSGSFEKARQFVFFDSELNDIVDVSDNPELELPDGGGLEAAEIIVGHETDILITGDVDPEAGEILGAGGVQVQICTDGSVQTAIQRCLAGELLLPPELEHGIASSPERPEGRGDSGNDPGGDATDSEVVGVEAECVCLICGHTQPHETGTTACEDTPCPVCGARMHKHLTVE